MRPGPLSAKMHLAYAHRKNGLEDISYPIRGCEDFLKQTYGNIVYQEQLMMISKTVSGFDDGQADSLTRKVTAKKKQDQMEMLRRCHIYGKKNCEGPDGWETDEKAPWYDAAGKYGNEIPGAIAKGYTEQEMNDYWHNNPLQRNNNIKTVEIHEGITHIGNLVFFGCSSMTNISIPSFVEIYGPSFK